MNEQLSNSSNPEDEKIAQRLNHVAEQTHANAQFAAVLEERLRGIRQPRQNPLVVSFKKISPVLRWVFLLLLLTAALSWSIRTLIPAPQPAIQNTPALTDTVTPTTEAMIHQTATPRVTAEGSYDWRGTKLNLAISLPEEPAEANVFLVQPEQPATIESVQALADQFSMQGEIFAAEPEPNAQSAFTVTDGNQLLNVRSDRYFEYIPDSSALNSEIQYSINNPNAQAIIDEFMKSHHFDFPYRVTPSELYQGFYVQALTPDGFPLQHEFFSRNGLLFRLNDTQILSVSASLLRYEQFGTYGIKSVEEAFQQLLASTDFNGTIEGVHSGTLSQRWQRDYALNQTVTLYSWLYAIKSVDGQELRVSLDRFPAKGNLAGAENLGKITLVKATGQFTLENETQVFNIESWEVYKSDDHGFSGKDAFSGILQKQGDDVVIVSEEGTFILPNVPSEISLPLENAYVYGVTIGDVFEWEGIEHREIGEEGRGGGGSNGNGFYKLNLNGPPVSFPTQTHQPISFEEIIEYTVQENDTLSSIALNFGTSVDDLKQRNGLTDDVIFTGQRLLVSSEETGQSIIGQRIEGAHGILVVTIYRKADGNERIQYVLQPMNENGPFLVLEGANLQDLRAYHNLPVEISGTVTGIDTNGNMIVDVEHSKIPFPDIRIQLFQGKQRTAEVAGQPAILFTTEDGTTYVQMLTFDVPDTMTILGVEGDDVILEGRAIPGDTFGGYPTLHVFSGSMAVNPKNNLSTEHPITADQPNVVDEISGGEPFVLPAATIEQVELVYYIPETRYVTFDESSDAEYIQPAWRFYGHYSTGDEFEILIQALKQEYLTPELAPFTRPG